MLWSIAIDPAILNCDGEIDTVARSVRRPAENIARLPDPPPVGDGDGRCIRGPGAAGTDPPRCLGAPMHRSARGRHTKRGRPFAGNSARKYDAVGGRAHRTRSRGP